MAADDATTAPSGTARLVEATIALLDDEGPHAVRARAVASAAGTSTMALYGGFGGMPGLLRAVSDEGFERLGAAFRGAARTEDAVHDACLQALLYRSFARAHRHLFDLMFGLSAPGGVRPGPRDAAGDARGTSTAFDAAYRPIVEVAGRLVSTGRIATADPQAVAGQLWSFAHGFITLEMAGHHAHVADPLRDVMLPLGINVMVGLGDEPDRARRSTIAAAATAGLAPA
jgi:AcrR family transcriptional regulator